MIAKKLDVICLGRIAVDLYSQQIGSKLEDVTSFAKYLGGSSGNVAYGTALLGLKSSMLARVGDEHMGRFLRQELESVGADTSNLLTDKERLTALVILGIKDKDTFPLIFYRENCADMALSKTDFSEDYIASAKALAITGTHLSHKNTREAVIQALEYAKKNGVKCLLDIDYRPVLWGLTSLGDGETRYIDNAEVTKSLQDVLGYFDVIVGTEEEFHIAGGSTDTLTALKNVRKYSSATLVCKRGEKGCSVYENEVPDDLDAALNVAGARVEVLNVLGAGDAFMSGLLLGYINETGWKKACQYANACGALVVSRHGCAPAIPSREELEYYISKQESIKRPDLDINLQHLHRVTTNKKTWKPLCIFAFDHRKQLEDIALKHGVKDFNLQKSLIKKAKDLLLAGAFLAKQELADANFDYGVLIDTTYGQDALNTVTGQDFWIARPIEKPASRPLELEYGDLGTQLMSWPAEHIVKCLAFYHPKDEERIKAAQDTKLKEVYSACCISGHALLLEIILPADSNDKDEAYYVQAIEHLYSLGIKPNYWKLPGLEKSVWEQLVQVITKNDPHCAGILLLGLDAPKEHFNYVFKQAQGIDLIKGFAIGRTIFGEDTNSWFAKEINDQELIQSVAKRYKELIKMWKANTLS